MAPAPPSPSPLSPSPLSPSPLSPSLPSPSPPPAAALPELRLKLLGAWQVAVGPAPLSFKRRKAVALLAYLALSGRLHSREALASLLAAEDADDAQAKTQLRNTLYALG